METLHPHLLAIIGLTATTLHGLGLLSAVSAVMNARTSQGATAWAIALISFPYVSLPLFWIFGRDRFNGYVKARRGRSETLSPIFAKLISSAREHDALLAETQPELGVLEQLALMPFTRHNHGELLVDGTATFEAIFEGIESAKHYILVQFFIVRDDALGKQLKNKLIDASKRGVKVYFQYDEIGSHDLSNQYVGELKDHGVDIHPFRSNRGGLKNRFQLNFRNHRKIVLIDGKIAYVGGHNVGVEYLGEKPSVGHWRDTHMSVEGPAVMGLQVAFIEDWYWSEQSIPELHWDFHTTKQEDQIALALPTGPADKLDTCSLFFVQAINAAKKRIWITSPYFVPDGKTLGALQLAALRGVDVRIMLPAKPDHKLVYLASFSYLKETIPVGVKIYRYEKGFLHQKVLLVDDDFAGVGTANFDNRSFRLNFEITMLFSSRTFNKQVEDMLAEDFSHSRRVGIEDIDDRSVWFKIAVRFARLLGPIL